MDLDPQDYRSKLLELIYNTTVVTRFYSERILHAPVYISAPGWSRLARSAEQTAEHARRVLAADDFQPKHRTLDLDIPQPPAITDRLADNVAARRSRDHAPPTPTRPRPGVH